MLLQNSRYGGKLVERDGAKDRNGEDRHRAENGLVMRLDVARVPEIHANRDHRAVADHGLDIDADRGNKDRVGIDHHADARKECVGCQKGHQRAVYPAPTEDCRQESDVHGHGAELEGEAIPLIVGANGVPLHRKGVVDLLVDLKHRHKDRYRQHRAAHAAVVSLAVQSAKQNAKQDRKRQPKQMKPPVGGWRFHACIQEVQKSFQKVHGFTISLKV